MGIFILLVIVFFAYGFYQNWAKEQPQKAMDKIEEYVYQREVAFEKALKKAVDREVELMDMTIRMHGKKEYQKRHKTIEALGIHRKRLSNLKVHLLEKFKHDIKKSAEIWQDYVEWINAKLSIFSNYESMEFYDDLVPLYDEIRDYEIKAETIESRLKLLADVDMLKKLGLDKKKKMM